jgi:hypothetical protein
MPRSSWLAMKAAGTVTRISSACGRQAHTLSPRESASFTSAWFGAVPAVPAGDPAGLQSGTSRGHQRGGFPQDGEPDEPFILSRSPGRRPLPLAQQHGVAVRVEHLDFAAERVRRMPGADDRHARLLEHADHGLDVVVEEVEQQWQRREVQRGPVAASRTDTPSYCRTDQAEASAVPEECSRKPSSR